MNYIEVIPERGMAHLQDGTIPVEAGKITRQLRSWDSTFLFEAYFQPFQLPQRIILDTHQKEGSESRTDGGRAGAALSLEAVQPLLAGFGERPYYKT